jgi:hypothetical protein
MCLVLTVNRYFITGSYINWLQKHRVNVSLDAMIKRSRALQKMNIAAVGANCLELFVL